MTYHSSKNNRTVQNELLYYQLESLLANVKKFGILSNELLLIRKRIKEQEKTYREYKESIDIIFRFKPDQAQNAAKTQQLLNQIIPKIKALKKSLRILNAIYQKKNSEKFFIEKEILNLAKEAEKIFPEIHNKELKSINDVNLKRISRLLQKKRDHEIDLIKEDKSCKKR